MNDNEKISQKANIKKQSYIVNNKSDIIISLDEQFAQPIEKRKKIYEFRKYKLTVEYPNKILEEGLRNKDFNQGLKVSKFAYKINHLYKLVNLIDSKQLKIHHPLGGGSYVFKEKYIDYILEHVPKSDVRISIEAQPNEGKNVKVILELVDIAISKEHSFNNIKYQKSLSYTKEIDKHIDYYKELLRKLNSYSGVVFMIRKQSDFNSHPRMSEVISTIIKEREKIGFLLSPKSKIIALSVAYPQYGLADKYEKKNIYEGNNNVISSCPKLEFNTPLRNFVKGVVYFEDNKDVTVPYSWVRVTGRDYAETYQEQILYKGASILRVNVTELPFILYSLLVIDWSDFKLSKSLYISEGAYGYLKEQDYDYLIDYSSFKRLLVTAD
ncbi:22512_t:CDS:2 [Rhizophagus irregularis]|nr:22512_t:CDS:2 [Rhizophagus irregularis]